MPRMQVYLPDDLYAEVKSRGLRASELLQDAIRTEVRRQELVAEFDRHVADLVDEVAQPSAVEVAAAEALARRIGGHLRPHSG